MTKILRRYVRPAPTPCRRHPGEAGESIRAWLGLSSAPATVARRPVAKVRAKRTSSVTTPPEWARGGPVPPVGGHAGLVQEGDGFGTYDGFESCDSGFVTEAYIRDREEAKGLWLYQHGWSEGWLADVAKLDWGVLSDLTRFRSERRRWAAGRPRRASRQVDRAGLRHAEGRYRRPVVWAQHWADLAEGLYPASEIPSLQDALAAARQGACAVTPRPSTGKRLGPPLDTSPRKHQKMATRTPLKRQAPQQAGPAARGQKLDIPALTGVAAGRPGSAPVTGTEIPVLRIWP